MSLCPSLQLPGRSIPLFSRKGAAAIVVLVFRSGKNCRAQLRNRFRAGRESMLTPLYRVGNTAYVLSLDAGLARARVSITSHINSGHGVRLCDQRGLDCLCGCPLGHFPACSAPHCAFLAVFQRLAASAAIITGRQSRVEGLASGGSRGLASG